MKDIHTPTYIKHTSPEGNLYEYTHWYTRSADSIYFTDYPDGDLCPYNYCRWSMRKGMIYNEKGIPQTKNKPLSMRKVVVMAGSEEVFP